MNIRIQRQFQTESDVTTIRERLRRWSDKYGFSTMRDQDTEWEFRRGSHLVAAFTFDVRKIPTVATITVPEDKPSQVECIMHVKSPWSFATPGDPKRVEEQVELLMAYAMGAFDL